MTAFYSKVGRLTFKDSVISVRCEFRVKIIELQQLRCVAKCPQTGGDTFTPSSCKSSRGQPIDVWMLSNKTRDTKKLMCPGCGGSVEAVEPHKAFKLYTNLDHRIAPEPFFSDLLQYKDPEPKHPGLSIRSLRLRRPKFTFGMYGRYPVLKNEMYRIFQSYEEFAHAMSSIFVVERKRRLKTTVKWIPSPIPSLEVLEQEYAQATARKFGRRL